MYFYFILLPLTYKCVCSFALKTGFIAPPRNLALDSRLKSHTVETLTTKGSIDGLVYARDGVDLKLPPYPRPRNRFIRILDQTADVDYVPLDQILKKVKVLHKMQNHLQDQSLYSNFSNIKTTFLEIAKWMFFRREEAIKDSVFAQLRTEVLSNADLFGSVYSRFLKHLLKSSNLYGGFGIRNGLKYYIKYRNRGFTDSFSLPEFLNRKNLSYKIPDLFYERLLKLCTENDRIAVLKNVFADSRIHSRSLLRDMFSNLYRPIFSDWGLLSLYVIRHGKKSTIELIKRISKPDGLRSFDHIKTGESDLEFANRHFGTVLNLFSQIYKISNHINSKGTTDKDLSTSDDVPSRQNAVCNQKIRVITNETTPEELTLIYYNSKFELSKLGKLEDFVTTFMEVVDFLNLAVKNKAYSPDFLNAFISSTCSHYMDRIKEYFAHLSDKLDVIYYTLFSKYHKTSKMDISKHTLDKFRAFGLDCFSNIFQDPESEPTGDSLYGIMKDSSSKFIYDFKKSRIIASSNTESMDSKNFRGNVFEGVDFCHLVISSNSEDLREIIDRNLNLVKGKYLGKFNPGVLDSKITLDIPKFDKNKVNPFDKKELRTGNIFIHPVNQELLMTVHEW